MTAEAVAEKGNVPIRDAVERMYRDYNAGLIYVGINYDGTNSEFKVSGDEEEVMRWSDNTKDHSIVSWYHDGELKLKVAVRRPSKRAGS